VKEHCDYRTYQKFEKDNPPKEEEPKDPAISDEAKESEPTQGGV